jgi:LAS superfamily LD-carboxypeptidase LdcB
MSYHQSGFFLDAITLSGRTEWHLVEFDDRQLHRDLVAPLRQLMADASQAGFDLALASAFRSFERQCLIWNDKAAGKRPVLADDGSTLDVAQLSPDELVFAILRWSALPGASRHHWGTDVDVYDRYATRDGYQVRLTLDETVGSGVFADLHTWLDEHLAHKDVGFFRPYRRRLGGVAPEPWHLSYAPLAKDFQRVLEPKALRDLLATSDIALKVQVLRHFDEIFERFIRVPWHLYPEACRSC